MEIAGEDNGVRVLGVGAIRNRSEGDVDVLDLDFEGFKSLLDGVFLMHFFGERLQHVEILGDFGFEQRLQREVVVGRVEFLVRGEIQALRQFLPLLLAHSRTTEHRDEGNGGFVEAAENGGDAAPGAESFRKAAEATNGGVEVGAPSFDCVSELVRFDLKNLKFLEAAHSLQGVVDRAPEFLDDFEILSQPLQAREIGRVAVEEKLAFAEDARLVRDVES